MDTLGLTLKSKVHIPNQSIKKPGVETPGLGVKTKKHMRKQNETSK